MSEKASGTNPILYFILILLTLNLIMTTLLFFETVSGPFEDNIKHSMPNEKKKAVSKDINEKLFKILDNCKPYLKKGNTPDKNLRNAISSMNAQVINDEGYFVISFQGVRDGDKILDARDFDGLFFIKDIIHKEKKLSAGEIGSHSYFWKNPGEHVAKERLIKFVYIPDWKWIVFIRITD